MLDSVLPRLGWQARKRLGHLATRAVAYPLTTILAIIFSMPLYWMVNLSLKTKAELERIPPTWLPEVIDWRNYLEVLGHPTRPLHIFMKNSAFYAVVGTFGVVLSCSLAAYAFARFQFMGRDALFVLVLSTMMLPSQVTLIPQYLIFKGLHWLDSYKPLIVPDYLGNAFYIFLLRQFFLTIPLEMDEAALIDGASRFDIYARILMPLSKPILVTVIAFGFIFRWNAFFGPLIYINTTLKQPIAVGLALYRNPLEIQIDYLMAGSVMSVFPIILVFLFCQRSFIAGITMTGLKG